MAKSENHLTLRVNNLRDELNYYSDIYERDLVECNKLLNNYNAINEGNGSVKLNLINATHKSDHIQKYLEESKTNITHLTKNISMSTNQEKTIKDYLNNFSEFVYPDNTLANKELTGLINLIDNDF